jgi:hypothetical protein
MLKRLQLFFEMTGILQLALIGCQAVLAKYDVVGNPNRQDDDGCRRPSPPSADSTGKKTHEESVASLLRVICTCSGHP